MDTPSKQSANRASFFAGPVFYFNESVGLEFTVGYSTTKSFQIKGNKSILMGLGIQFHLEKDK